MKHLGDITKINGHEIEPVDCICGGSPCQDLSVGGLKAGLAGERSRLFFEQIRIVKEMREDVRTDTWANNNIRPRPRYMVWENVKNAIKTNGGKDFQTVLTETARIAGEWIPTIPLPKGGWNTAGCIMGNGTNGEPFSVAWRVFDSQFWGTPMRRNRIALVADFAGTSAAEILFERDSLQRDFRQSREKENENSYENDGSIAFKSTGFGAWAETSIAATVRASGGDYGGGSETLILDGNGLRKMVPIEVERLFGYPDGWTDIGEWYDGKGRKRKSVDTARHKALGNSIALPFWFWLLRRISAQYERPATMGSLFDGIGGFPLCWERCNGAGTAIWASEVDEFAIAVTKKRFPGVQ